MNAALHHSLLQRIFFLEEEKRKDGKMISRIATALRRQTAYNRTRNELSRLSDRELQDLGINRADIRSVARAGVAAL